MNLRRPKSPLHLKDITTKQNTLIARFADMSERSSNVATQKNLMIAMFMTMTSASLSSMLRGEIADLIQRGNST